MSAAVRRLQDEIGKCEVELKALQESFHKDREAKTGRYSLSDMKDPHGVKYGDAVSVKHEIKERRPLRGHFGKIYALHWCKSEGKLEIGDEKVVSASQDGKLIVWNALSGNKLKLIPLASAWVMTVAFSGSGDFVACGGLDNICSVYRLSAHGIPDEKSPPVRPAFELQHHDGYLSCCRFLDDTKMLTCSGDHTCVLWDINEQKVNTIFEGHENDVMCLAPFGANNTFISAGCDMTARVWDLRSKTQVRSQVKNPTQTFAGSDDKDGHTSDINAIDLFPDSHAFGTGSDDSSCRIFDQRCWGQVQCVVPDQGNTQSSVTSCAFSGSGRFMVAGYDDFSTRVWDVLTGKPAAGLSKLESHEKRVSCLGINKSGKAICTGSWDDSLKIWG